MKKFFLPVLLVVVIFTLSGCSYASNSQTNPTGATQTPSNANGSNSIEIRNFSFNPAKLTIKAGTTVTWTNGDSAPHQIKSDSFNSSPLSQGQSYSFQFNDPGTYDYICSIHPSMKGEIVVQ